MILTVTRRLIELSLSIKKRFYLSDEFSDPKRLAEINVPPPPPNLSYMGTLDQFLKGDCPFNPGKESFPNLKKMVLIKDTSAIILETVPLTQFHVLPGRLSL